VFAVGDSKSVSICVVSYVFAVSVGTLFLTFLLCIGVLDCVKAVSRGVVSSSFNSFDIKQKPALYY